MVRVRRENFAVFGMHGVCDDCGATAGKTHGHHYGFGGGGGAVIHGRVGYFHARQLANHGLKFEDGLQRALRDFRLVGCVGGEELAARNK